MKYRIKKYGQKGRVKTTNKNPSVWNYKNNSLLYEIEKSKKVPKKERAKITNISLT